MTGETYLVTVYLISSHFLTLNFLSLMYASLFFFFSFIFSFELPHGRRVSIPVHSCIIYYTTGHLMRAFSFPLQIYWKDRSTTNLRLEVQRIGSETLTNSQRWKIVTSSAIHSPPGFIFRSFVADSDYWALKSMMGNDKWDPQMVVSTFSQILNSY